MIIVKLLIYLYTIPHHTLVFIACDVMPEKKSSKKFRVLLINILHFRSYIRLLEFLGNQIFVYYILT